MAVKKNGETDLFSQKCGTAGYIAPEILRNENYDEKVDIFSAGVILYWLLSGTLPFAGANTREVTERNLQDKIEFTTFLVQPIKEPCIFHT